MSVWVIHVISSEQKRLPLFPQEPTFSCSTISALRAITGLMHHDGASTVASGDSPDIPNLIRCKGGGRYGQKRIDGHGSVS